MGVKAKGRGAAATFGFLLVLAGIAGAAVLWFMAERRPDQAVDGFARGPVGCTTTLEFTDQGRFYVYEESIGNTSVSVADCDPIATPGAEFGFELLDDGRPVVIRGDDSISYDTDIASGTSVGWIEIVEPGRYDLVVQGSDPGVVAAIGRDPQDGVDDLRRGAIAVGAVGVVLGGLMLLLAGRRSKKAATYQTPAGPGWRPEGTEPPAPDAWPPQAPTVPPIPVAPMLSPDRLTSGPVATATVPADQQATDRGPDDADVTDVPQEAAPVVPAAAPSSDRVPTEPMDPVVWTEAPSSDRVPTEPMDPVVWTEAPSSDRVPTEPMDPVVWSEAPSSDRVPTEPMDPVVWTEAPSSDRVATEPVVWTEAPSSVRVPTEPAVPGALPSPEVVGSEVTPSEVALPEVVAPETALPEVVLPGVLDGSPTADVTAPDAVLPDVASPDAVVPDAVLPDAVLPDVVLPDVVVPDVVVPDVASPDAVLPDVVLPDVTPPDVAPGAAVPPAPTATDSAARTVPTAEESEGPASPWAPPDAMERQDPPPPSD